MQENFLITMTSFLSHNWPLVLFGTLSVFFLFLIIIKPTRRMVLFFIGFSALTINFEYRKHLFSKIQNDMVNLIFPEGTRFTIYRVLILTLKYIVPITVGFIGYGCIVLGFILKKQKKD